jgi:hypothetical protein
MQLQTSYYTHPDIATFTNRVAISCSTQAAKDRVSSGITWRNYPPLAPDWRTMVEPYRQQRISQQEYTNRYNIQLSRLDPSRVLEDLGDKATLLCYELPNQFCHRRLVADWFCATMGLIVPEYATNPDVDGWIM